MSSQLQGSILGEARLLTLAMTFSSALRVPTETSLLPSRAPPPSQYLTLCHYYLPIPRERGTIQMMAEEMVEGTVKGTVDGTMATHSFHMRIIDGLIIILTVVSRRLTNPIGLPIVPHLMLLPLHPWA